MSTEKENETDGERVQFRAVKMKMEPNAEPGGSSRRTSATPLTPSPSWASQVEPPLGAEQQLLQAKYASLLQSVSEMFEQMASALRTKVDVLDGQQRELGAHLQQMDVGLSAISRRVDELVADTERAAVATCDRLQSHRCNVALGASNHQSSL